MNNPIDIHTAALRGDLQSVRNLVDADPNQAKTLNINQQYPTYSALLLPVGRHPELQAIKEKIFIALFDASLIRHQDNSGDTIMHWLAASGFATLFNELTKHLPPNDPVYMLANHQGLCPIHVAILNQQKTIATLLLKSKEMFFLAGHDGRLPIHYAAQFSDKEMVVRCCGNYTDELVNMPDSFNHTPSSLAETYNVEHAEDILEFLDTNGAYHFAKRRLDF